MKAQAQNDSDEVVGIKEGAEAVVPSFTISASDPQGMWLMVKLTHMVRTEHKADPQLKARLNGLMREFELWHEAKTGRCPAI